MSQCVTECLVVMGVYKGVFRVEIRLTNHEGDMELKVQSIFSPSYRL